ncbi:hypothetical protein AWC38_SpisGene11947 [Stylophora pistillata]|uniref:Integrase catalytic domain-containing protein n=1 Tax=Stylophora pistillata TaxID=50429 RepID=A0A2B4S4M4_STYPI|nr:hypothetical protein AWC38_SpisGene11947 [Stylophora pistillata]
MSFPQEKADPSKRGILSKVARIYDPQGGKILYRDVCDSKQNWDAKLPSKLMQSWIRWEERLPEQLTVPRSLAAYQEDIQSTELHAFGDASDMGSKKKSPRRSVQCSQKRRFPLGELSRQRANLRDTYLSKNKELCALRKKVKRLQGKGENVQECIKQLEQTTVEARPSAFEISKNASTRRKRDPSELCNEGKLNLPRRSGQRRQLENLIAATEIHGGTVENRAPALEGMVSTVLKYGSELSGADALSRAYLEETKESLIPELEVNEVQLTAHLPISQERYSEFQQATAADPTLQALSKVVRSGWPCRWVVLQSTEAYCSSEYEKRNRAQPREPMIIQNLPDRMWSKVGTDLFEYNGIYYILCVAYYSKWTELAKLDNLTSSNIICHPKSQFACPHSPQANGEAERAVQTIKNLLKKAQDPYKALLNYRNTPLDGINLSPAQLLMGRRLKTSLPTMVDLLTPPRSQASQQQFQKRKEREKSYYNQNSRKELPLTPGSKVSMQLENEWIEATAVNKPHTPRSYIVQTPNGKFY